MQSEKPHAICHGYADAIISGGAEAAINEVAIAGFANCKALTTCEDPESACTPFDKRRSGFVMGEGAGILVLEEYEHAKARGAHIYAEMVGMEIPAMLTTLLHRIQKQRVHPEHLNWLCRKQALRILQKKPFISTHTAPAPH